MCALMLACVKRALSTYFGGLGKSRVEKGKKGICKVCEGGCGHVLQSELQDRD